MQFNAFTVFDVECTSLQHLDGHAFAVGAVRMNMAGRVISRFSGRCPIIARPSVFVAEKVIPALSNMTQTHADERALRDSFWEWLHAHRNPVFADMGNYADAPFLDLCTKDDLNGRALKGLPFPLHEVATLLLMAGVRVDVNRETYGKQTGFFRPNTCRRMKQHHPLFDAYTSGLSIIQAVREINSRMK